MPGLHVIYDPGRLLIAAARRSGIPIEIIPGASAVVTAVAVSGMDGNAFVFEGRCPVASRASHITRLLKAESRTMIFFSPAQVLRRFSDCNWSSWGTDKSS